MPLRDYSWIIFLPFVALGWMAFKAALENAAALIVWLVYSLFLLFPILPILRYPCFEETGSAARSRASATALSVVEVRDVMRVYNQAFTHGMMTLMVTEQRKAMYTAR